MKKTQLLLTIVLYSTLYASNPANTIIFSADGKEYNLDSGLIQHAPGLTRVLKKTSQLPYSSATLETLIKHMRHVAPRSKSTLLTLDKLKGAIPFPRKKEISNELLQAAYDLQVSEAVLASLAEPLVHEWYKGKAPQQFGLILPDFTHPNDRFVREIMRQYFLQYGTYPKDVTKKDREAYDLGYSIQELSEHKLLPSVKNGILNLSNYKINSLHGMDKLAIQGVTQLDLSNNTLSDLHGLPENLYDLKKLNISNNKLISLDGIPRLMSMLEDLNLHNNLLSDWRSIPVHFPKLIELDASNNLFTSLEGMPRYMPRLERLSFHENLIRNLRGMTQHIPRIRKLDYSYNNLKKLDNIPQHMPELEVLDLQSNDLNTLQGLPEDLPQLKLLNVANNPVSANYNAIMTVENLLQKKDVVTI